MRLKQKAIFSSLLEMGKLRETGHDSIGDHVIFCRDGLKKISRCGVGYFR